MNDMARVETLAGIAREYLHRYGWMMANLAGEDVTSEVLAIEGVICDLVKGDKEVDG